MDDYLEDVSNMLGRPVPIRKPSAESSKRLFGMLAGIAIRDGAREMQLQPRSKRGGFKVFYLFPETDELEEWMNLSWEHSPLLRAYLTALADENGAFSIVLESDEPQISITYEFNLRAENSTYGETLILAIRPALNGIDSRV